MQQSKIPVSELNVVMGKSPGCLTGERVLVKTDALYRCEHLNNHSSNSVLLLFRELPSTGPWADMESER